MSDLRKGLEEYLAVRHGLGHGLRLTRGALHCFVTFAEAEGADYITTDLALRWAQQPADAQGATWTRRLAMVRIFATWLSAMDPRTEVPPEGLLQHRYRRKRPHIYRDEEIDALLRATRKLPSAHGLRSRTYVTFFALLAVTGMRMSEGLNLDDGDVDATTGILTIRRTKFAKSRLVPVHPSTTTALEAYRRRRDRAVPVRFSSAFFVSERGTRITEWAARRTFAKVSQQIGLRDVPPDGRDMHGRGPRLHDLRHRFAVRTLIDWYRAGLDVEREMPKLATYLGHAHVNDTYWYLEAIPELLALATDRVTKASQEPAP